MKFRTLANSALGKSGTVIDVPPDAPLPIGLGPDDLGPLQIFPLCTEASVAYARWFTQRGLAPHSRHQSHGPT
jgi:hypothetical protein